ncbi:MAG: hypothetical protein PVF76_03565 [Syntrophobacterales bacterium]|jgi:hypothetical protein
MKASVITMLLVAAMLLGANFVHAESGQLESYYNDCVTKKIANCKRIASTSTGKSSSMIRLVEIRTAQAKFYRNHREELVKEMVARNIGKKQYKIDYFLITKFKETA